ncbi:hypothetical protein DUNSADRAFT_3150 [Dunaliella salina]|uniref:Encoded protein n=1 Tax=Dunaliella salina TaxID=3046 RepID=A0ABQ7H840_DUNSA|nr:hypothetical protein DUNSADRAFT_3150 [Dunaliella salina]|eukprot:KAF5843021.1 hypothetical protein DUNSADRAFT_3150 [Dunaliella salina]
MAAFCPCDLISFFEEPWHQGSLSTDLSLPPQECSRVIHGNCFSIETCFLGVHMFISVAQLFISNFFLSSIFLRVLLLTHHILFGIIL